MPALQEIRPIDLETDLLQVTRLINLSESDPATPFQVRGWIEHMPPGRDVYRRVGTNSAGEMIAYSYGAHETWNAVRQYSAWVIVDPPYRRQGVGSAMWEDVKAFLNSRKAKKLTSEVRDQDADSLQFAKARRFEIDRHLFESTLDLTAFDSAPYAHLRPMLEAQGICICSLADFQNSPEARRKLYEVNYRTALDIPGSEENWFSFDEFEQTVAIAEWFRPEGQLLALDGEKFVGLSAIQLIPQKRGSYNLMTGVLPDYRGRKIALALKLEAIRYAREHGAVYMRTNNDSLNAPMLSINRKLGYMPQPGKYKLRSTLYSE